MRLSDLRREVESLLAAHERAGNFVEGTPGNAATDWLAREDGPRVAGERICAYEVVSLLGRGGMGDSRVTRDWAVRSRSSFSTAPSPATATPPDGSNRKRAPLPP
jgi:hypothetical protein